MSVEEFARSYFRCVTERDVDGMMEHWTPGGTGHIEGVAELTAPGTYGDWFRDLFAAFPDFRFEVEDVVADAERAMVHWRARGTFNGSVPFEGLLPTGASVDLRGIDLLRVRDGKLVELHAYMNAMELARQVGALPPHGSGPEKAMNAAFNLKTRVVQRLKGS